MWDSILLEVVKNVVVPELAAFIKKHYEEKGTWPTKEELEIKAKGLATQIINEGQNFINRVNPLENPNRPAGW